MSEHDLYAKVEEGLVVRTGERPKWLTDAGNPVSDARLAQDGWFPLDQTPPAYNQSRSTCAVRPMAEWTVGETTVSMTWTVADRDIGERKALMLAALANRRWQAEEGGTSLGGAPLATDRTTQTKVTAAYLKATANPAYTIPDWKGPAGWMTLTAPQIIAIGDTIEAHVQACFTREKQIATAIGAAEDHDALDQIDIHSGWPTT